MAYQTPSTWMRASGLTARIIGVEVTRLSNATVAAFGNRIPTGTV